MLKRFWKKFWVVVLASMVVLLLSGSYGLGYRAGYRSAYANVDPDPRQPHPEVGLPERGQLRELLVGMRIEDVEREYGPADEVPRWERVYYWRVLNPATGFVSNRVTIGVHDGVVSGLSFWHDPPVQTKGE
jgi:hypothetical protein